MTPEPDDLFTVIAVVLAAGLLLLAAAYFADSVPDRAPSGVANLHTTQD